MNYSTLVLLGGGILLGLQAKAQSISRESEPLRYVVGLQAVRSEYEIFFPTTPSMVSIGPWEVTVGIRIAPRCEAQLSYKASSHTSLEDPSYTGTTLTGQHTSGTRGADSRQQALPLLIRYAFIKSPHPRLQLDVVGGMTLVAAHFNSYGSDFVDGQLVREISSQGRAAQLFATLGVGARYPFGEHFEGVLDYHYSRNLKAVPEGIHQLVTGNKYGLTRALSLGLRYRFALPKKAAAPPPAP